MSDFCQECSIKMFGEDFGDMVHSQYELAPIDVLCEGCGPILVDSQGKKIDKSILGIGDFFQVKI